MAAAPAPVPRAEACPPLYRPRNPRATSLYQLLDTHFETLKRLWEERFENRYGFWRGFYETAVNRYLDCGLFESGFARAVCPGCRYEFLVALSCKGRGLCPSCGAKRAALFSELLQRKILTDVAHAQWVFSLPKMLRPYFLFHRELLAELARLAYETVREMMAAASDEPDARPGMVAVIQTFGSSLKWNPHIHAIVTRGVFLPDGSWQPIAYVDTHRTELLFRHKLLRLLRNRQLISQERIDLLLSWRHSGFQIHNHTTVYPNDTEGLHRLACYLQRPPVNLTRLHHHPESRLIVYEPKHGDDADTEVELMEPLEFLARVLIHIPQPNRHLVRFYGVYANRLRSQTFGIDHSLANQPAEDQDRDVEEPPPKGRALQRRWAELLYRIYEVDPLSCPRCGEKMKILAFISDPAVIRRILDHLDRKARPRAPPKPQS